MALTRISSPSLITANTFNDSQVNNLSITTSKLSLNSITGNLIADNTLTLGKILSSTSSFQQLVFSSTGTLQYSNNKAYCINRVIQTYNIPFGAPASFTWVPGLFIDYTPLRADSIIRWAANYSWYWNDGSYGIQHQLFYWNNQLRDQWTLGAQYGEKRLHYERMYPSWGTTSGRIGIQCRYYSGNYYGAFHGTRYWNGDGGTSGNTVTQLVLEEFLNN